VVQVIDSGSEPRVKLRNRYGAYLELSASDFCRAFSTLTVQA
jgi:hypothetical protein